MKSLQEYQSSTPNAMLFPYFVSCLSCTPSPLASFKAQVGARTRDGRDLGVASYPGNIPCRDLQPLVSSEPSQLKPGVYTGNFRGTVVMSFQEEISFYDLDEQRAASAWCILMFFTVPREHVKR